MGKFDGILLVTDLDGTLLCTDKSISKRNTEAIARFEAEGGLFTYVTGRPPLAMAPVLDQLRPKLPIGCLNGGGVCDLKTGKFIDRTLLSRDAFALVDDIAKQFPNVGFEFVTFQTCYLYHSNAVTEELKRFERLPGNYVDSFDIPGDLCKILFGADLETMPALMAAVNEHPESKKYALMRTADEYYELLPKGCHKGNCLTALVKHLNVSPKRTIAVGDNSNDAPMLRVAGLGIAVANATEDAKDAAALVLSETNDQHAIAAIIERLERGELQI